MLNYAMILKGLREKKRLTQSGLADEYGTDQSTISRLETGASKEPLAELHDRIVQDARRHGLIPTATEGTLSALPSPNGAINGHAHRPRTVPIIGQVDAASDDNYISMVGPGRRIADAVFPNASKSMAAIAITGDALGAALHNWVAFFENVQAPITHDHVGKLCVVGLTNKRTVIKLVKYGERDGLYDLVSANHTIEAATIEWAAKVLLMAPQ